MALPPGRSIMYKSTTQREKAEIASMTSDSGRFFPVVDPAKPMVRWGLNQTLPLSIFVSFFLPFLRMIPLHICRKIILYWLSSRLLWQQLPFCWKMINQSYQLTGRGTSLGCHTWFNCLILKPHRTDKSKSRFCFGTTEQCLRLYAWFSPKNSQVISESKNELDVSINVMKRTLQDHVDEMQSNYNVLFLILTYSFSFIRF